MVDDRFHHHRADLVGRHGRLFGQPLGSTRLANGPFLGFSVDLLVKSVATGKKQSAGTGCAHQGKVKSKGSGGRIRYIRITDDSKESKAVRSTSLPSKIQ